MRISLNLPRIALAPRRRRFFKRVFGSLLLIFIIVFSKWDIVDWKLINICHWLASNCRSLESEATAFAYCPTTTAQERAFCNTILMSAGWVRSTVLSFLHCPLALSRALSINTATSEIFSAEKNSGAVTQTWAGWARSKNTITVLCRPPSCNNLCLGQVLNTRPLPPDLGTLSTWPQRLAKHCNLILYSYMTDGY